MAREAIILLAAGTDRPGIVDRISGAIFDASCNLEDSRMSILGGEFALMVLVTGTNDGLASLRSRLEPIASELGLVCDVKPAASPDSETDAAAAIPYRLHAVAMDHPGIVHKITHFLKERDVNVASLESRVSHAPSTGTPVFSLELEIHVPADQSIARLRSEVQALAEEDNIDITLDAAD